MLKLTFIILIFTIGIFGPLSSQDCPEGKIELNSQEQIDQFLIDYPDCTKIDGSLCIGYCNLPFGTEIRSDIVDLTPLSNLEEIKDTLAIQRNSDLISLNGLQNISNFDGVLKISENEVLTKFDELENIIHTIKSFLLWLNPQIKDLNILHGKDTLNMDILISRSIGISSLEAFEGTKIINGKLTINLSPNIKNFDGLDSVSKISQLHIASMDGIENFKGFDQLEEVTSYFGIINNISLVDLQGLEKLKKVGSLTLSGENAIQNLTGIENLKEINQNLNLSVASFIENLDPLENLEKVGGHIHIFKCLSLVDISGLRNIDISLMSVENLNLIIRQNANLSECSIEPICDILMSDSLTYEVSDNKSGCFTSDEILANCIVDIEDEEISKTIIFPNPTRGIIHLKNLSKDVLEAIVINAIGESRLIPLIKGNHIELNDYPDGIYTVLLLGKQKNLSFKVVKI